MHHTEAFKRRLVSSFTVRRDLCYQNHDNQSKIHGYIISLLPLVILLHTLTISATVIDPVTGECEV